MNITDSIDTTKAIAVAQLSLEGNPLVNSICMQEGAHLKKHITKVPALLLCVKGEIEYESIDGTKALLCSGDYVHIPAEVEHWLNAKTKVEAVLIR